LSPTGVLVAQVGTPDEPTPPAVRRYLARFLADRRVVDYAPWWWLPILRGGILPIRGRRSAALYRRIWTKEGSPLLVESRRQCAALAAALGDGYRVALGMAYAGPSFDAAVDQLIAEGAERIVVLPMFPQYSSTTTASIYDGVNAAATGRAGTFTNRQRRFVPSLHYTPPFFDHPGYIGALAVRIRRAIEAAPEAPDKIVLTFHGLPERYVATGDPYQSHCDQTTALLAERMGWQPSDYIVSYQSRFGPETWLEPATAEVLERLASQGVRRPLVVAPGFTTDCLETLDELGNEGRRQFAEGGGDPGAYTLCPCLNDLPEWIDCMIDLIKGVERGGSKL
jgi:ferrochelatase